MKYLFIGFLLVVVLVGLGINYLNRLEWNTVDPQVSSSIVFSKTNKFFIREYMSNESKYFDVKEAWLEYIWKKKLENKTLYYDTLGGVQLVLSLDSFRTKQIEDASYFFDWEIVCNGIVAGKGHGNYVVILGGAKIPETILILVRNPNTFKVLDSIELSTPPVGASLNWCLI